MSKSSLSEENYYLKNELDRTKDELNRLKADKKSVTDRIYAAVKTYLDQEDGVQGRVAKLLDEKLFELALNIIGVEKRFDGWRPTSTNGTPGLALQWLQTQAQEAAQRWCEKHFTEALEKAAVTPATIREFSDEYKRTFGYAAQERLRARAQERAKQVVDEEFNKVLKDLDLKEFL